MIPSSASCKLSSSESSVSSPVSIVNTVDRRTRGKRPFCNTHLASGSIWVPLRVPLKPPYMDMHFPSVPQTKPATVVKSSESTADKEKVKTQTDIGKYMALEARRQATRRQTRGCPYTSLGVSARKEVRKMDYHSEHRTEDSVAGPSHSTSHRSKIYSNIKLNASKTADYLEQKENIMEAKKPRQCNYKTESSGNLPQPSQMLSGTTISLMCSKCSYKATVESELIEHMRTHAGDKPFLCELCNYRTERKSCYTIHMRKHTGETPFACTMCDYATAHKGNLTTHMRIHTGEKPFACHICDYATAQKCALTTHMRIHTGETPFACRMCDFATAHKCTLTTHMRIHTGETPFACPMCDYAAADKRTLARHMRRHTGKTPFACPN